MSRERSLSQQQDARKFFRACDQRLAAAGCLLENGFHLEAIYIGGYAVECALKGVLLKTSARRHYPEVKEKVTAVGAKGHDFEYLKHLLKKQKCPVDNETAEALGRVTGWSTDLRYEVGAVKYADARQFLQAAHLIKEWSKRS
jgi:HEPN domain-containing protein